MFSNKLHMDRDTKSSQIFKVVGEKIPVLATIAFLAEPIQSVYFS